MKIWDRKPGKGRRITLISGFGGAKKTTGGGTVGTLVTPVYHNWDGETSGALPSFCSPTVIGNDTMVVTNNHPVNWSQGMSGITAANPEVGLVDLGGTFGSGDAGIRLLMLARGKSGSSAYINMFLEKSSDSIFSSDFLFYRMQENQTPDQWQARREIGSVEDMNDTYDDGSHGTGEGWHYYMFEQLASGATYFGVYNSAGVLDYEGTRPFVSSSGLFPEDLRYMGMRGVNGGNIEVAQIWAGRSGDAWPSLPMTPITNL